VQQRLAAALRENLKRRKAQTRGKAEREAAAAAEDGALEVDQHSENKQ